MSLSVGIVGLPNVGKSTLFNALLKKQAAFVANYPFATIEPNVGVVPVPDERLTKLAGVVSEEEGMTSQPPVVPATIKFIDIAGLIAGAHKGEGLGNKFLAHIREVDLICHVVRAFKDPEVVKQGVVDPKSDFETVKTELELADLETVERRKKKDLPAQAGKKGKISEELPLLSKKPILVVLNMDEEDLKNEIEIETEYAKMLEVKRSQIVVICAKLESELASLFLDEQAVYLNELGIDRSGLERLIKKAYETLGLISFLTAGEKEVRAWTLPAGTPAVRASSTIHTDFEKHFIKADVVDFEDFVKYGGWKKCREIGKVRSEGRDYIVQDGDIIEFKIGN